MRLFHTQTNSGVFSTSGSGSTWMSGSRSVDSGGIGVVGRDGNSGVVLSRSSSGFSSSSIGLVVGSSWWRLSVVTGGVGGFMSSGGSSNSSGKRLELIRLDRRSPVLGRWSKVSMGGGEGGLAASSGGWDVLRMMASC